MSNIAEHIAASRGLLQALEAISNRRAFVTLLLTALVTSLLFMAVSYLSLRIGMRVDGAGVVLGFLGFLMVLALGMIGVSAAGFLVHDQMHGQPVRSMADALWAALVTLPRVIGIALLVALVVLLTYLAIVIALLICKIPGLGPLLYFFVFPLAALTIGVVWSALAFVISLAWPSVWEGHGVMRTLGGLWAITRERLLAVVIQSLLLSLMVGVVAALVWGIVFTGVIGTGFLSGLVLSDGSEYGGFGGMHHGWGYGRGFWGGQGGAYATAAALGGGLLMLCAAVIPGLVVLAGYCIIYRNVSTGLSADAYAARLSGAMDSVKQKADTTRQQMDAQRNAATGASTIATTPPAAMQCPQCHGAVTASDAFCGNCGHKLGGNPA